jgi:hypothetical protein
MNKYRFTKILEYPESINIKDIVDTYTYKFEDNRLQQIYGLYGDLYTLSNKELTELVKSTQFKQLRLLELCDQSNLTDEHIKTLCENKYFSRINIINFKSTNITKLSIDYIKNSKYIGSVRDRPQINNKYGIPGSVVIIYTDIKCDDELEQFKFVIDYKPLDFCYPYEPVRGIKTIEIRNCYD